MDTESLKNIYSTISSLRIIEGTSSEENSKKAFFADKEKSHDETAYYLNNSKFQVQVPDELLMQKIIQQVEFLFSDANLAKDKFLLKHIRRNKEGYVSLKLISSLRKVKAHTKDWRVVAYSLQKSKKLQMNEEKTKIRRIEPLKILEDIDSARTVLVFHIIPSCCTSESMKNILNKLGTVTSLSIINSKTDIMNLMVKRTIKVHQDIATFPFAVVKFETPDEAANAILQTTHPSSILKIVPPALDGNPTTKCSEISLSKDNKEFFLGDKLSAERSEISEERINPFPQLNSLNAAENLRLSKLEIQKQRGKRCSRLAKAMHLPNILQDKEAEFLPCGFRGDGFTNRRAAQRKFYFDQPKETRVIALRHPKGPDNTKGFQQRGVNLGIVTF